MDAKESSCALVLHVHTLARRSGTRRAGWYRDKARREARRREGVRGDGLRATKGGGQVTPPRGTVAAGEITAPSLLAGDVHKLCITLSGAHAKRV